MRVLLIENDQRIAGALERTLDAAGIEMDWAEDAEDGAQALQEGGSALVLLDLALPDLDGEDLLAGLSQRGDHVPLMVIGRDPQDRLRGLALGADDCLIKPVAASELLARMGALLRRQGPMPGARMATPGP